MPLRKMSKKAPERRPRVVANFAVTADGKTSTRNFTPSLFTSPADKVRLQEIRAVVDAVLAGRGTVAADTMSMGLSREALRRERVKRGEPPVPLRVLISNAGRLDAGWKVFQYQESTLVVLSTTRMPANVRSRIAPHCDLHLFDAPEVPLRTALALLRKDYGVRSLVCEGGGTLFRSLAVEDLIDELYLTVAPVIFGGKLAPTLTGALGDFLPEPLDFRITSVREENGECFLHLRRVRKRGH